MQNSPMPMYRACLGGGGRETSHSKQAGCPFGHFPETGNTACAWAVGFLHAFEGHPCIVPLFHSFLL